ncbi:hypothetical protein [Tellurirhabdus bombi]|uniref:hypothetical protein n=1 Tax=Tellurirhabdus bombi TaxID=2907205 RepID=UPI001F24335C|nr:hypothetical protein [Tellurirhabdus bombi]
MKLFSAIVLLLVSTVCFGQNGGKRVMGPVTTTRGLVLKEGDILRFGKGSLSSGWYKNAFTSIKRIGQKDGQLDEGYAYVTTTVREFYEIGSGQNKRLVALVRPKGGISISYKAVDLDPAIDSKEIISVNGVAIPKLLPKKDSKKL